MSDNLVLYGPGGASPVNLGSWLQADPGPDYGARGLLQAVENEAPFDGGVYVYERAGIRHMQVPLILASGGAGLSLTQLESLIRMNARPGGYIDLQPQGVASSEAVRFDLVHGRWQPAYSVFHQRLPRRQGQLLLDTQPYGYWPTWITIASMAGAQITDRITLASVFGDAPADVRMVLTPTVSGQFPTGTWYPDLAAFSLVGASFTPILGPLNSGQPTVMAYGLPGSYVSDANLQGLGGTAFQISLSGLNGWSFAALWFNNDAVNSVRFYGRHRLFAWAKLTPSTGFPIQLVADAGNVSELGEAMASANPVATLAPAVGSGVSNVGAWGAFTSPAYTLVDLGELQIPRDLSASAFSGMQVQLRLSAYSVAASQVATPLLTLGGFFLHSLDTPNAIITEGRNVPSINSPQVPGAYQIDSTRRSFEVTVSFGATVAPPLKDLRRFTCGQTPWATPSSGLMTVLIGGRKVSPIAATGPYAHSGIFATNAFVQIRPRFQFLKGL